MLELRGCFEGTLTVSEDEDGKKVFAEEKLSLNAEDWTSTAVKCGFEKGVHALHLSFRGEGNLEFRTFGFLS